MICNIIEFVMTNVFLPLLVLLLLIIVIFSVVFLFLQGIKCLKEMIADFRNQK